MRKGAPSKKCNYTVYILQVLQGVSGPIVRLNAIYCNNSVEKDPGAIRFFSTLKEQFGGFVGKQRLANRN